MIQAKTRCVNSFKLVSTNHDGRSLKLQKLQRFAEATETCRHIAICRYFGEIIDDKNPEISEAYCGKMCDVRRTDDHL